MYVDPVQQIADAKESMRNPKVPIGEHLLMLLETRIPETSEQPFTATFVVMESNTVPNGAIVEVAEWIKERNGGDTRLKTFSERMMGEPGQEAALWKQGLGRGRMIKCNATDGGLSKKGNPIIQKDYFTPDQNLPAQLAWADANHPIQEREAAPAQGFTPPPQVPVNQAPPAPQAQGFTPPVQRHPPAPQAAYQSPPVQQPAAAPQAAPAPAPATGAPLPWQQG